MRVFFVLWILASVLSSVPIRGQGIKSHNLPEASYVKKYDVRLKLSQVGFLVGGAFTTMSFGRLVLVEPDAVSLVGGLIGICFLYEGCRSRKNARDLQRIMLKQLNSVDVSNDLGRTTSVEQWLVLLNAKLACISRR